MKTIWKFLLKFEDEQIVELPGESLPIAVGQQNNQLILWAEVVPGQRITKCPILIRGTGQSFQGNEGQHIGSVKTHSDTFVWHVYRKK